MPTCGNDPSFLVTDLELDGDVEGRFATDLMRNQIWFAQEITPSFFSISLTPSRCASVNVAFGRLIAGWSAEMVR